MTKKQTIAFIRYARRALAMCMVWAVVIAAGVTVYADPVSEDVSTGNVVINADGEYIVTGSTTTYNLTVNSGVAATITLNGVSINVTNKSPIDIKTGATVTLILAGTNTLTADDEYAALHVPPGATLIIMGNGSLAANSSNGAAIGGNGADHGGGTAEDAGTITINSGTVTAVGSVLGAGIGGGGYSAAGDGGTITINGGNVTASSANGAGIGGGSASGAYAGGSGGDITISSGTVTAFSYHQGAGIGGGGIGGDGGNITITGGTVTASGKASSSSGGGAGIGGAQGGDGGNITISGGRVTANGGNTGAGIGGGLGGDGGVITISGGRVTATGGAYFHPTLGTSGGAGIGGGAGFSTTGKGSGGTVVITGSSTEVTATGGGGANDIGLGVGGSTPTADGGTLEVDGNAKLTLGANGTDASITLGDCVITGAGAGTLKGTYESGVKVTPSPGGVNDARDDNQDAIAIVPVYSPVVGVAGLSLDLSGISLPGGAALVSKTVAGLPSSAASSYYTISATLAGENGSLGGRAYLRRYELTLTDEQGKAYTGNLGTVTVRIAIPKGAGEPLSVFYYNPATDAFTDMGATTQNGYVTFTTTHFSTFLLTGQVLSDKPSIPETGAAMLHLLMSVLAVW